mmetsp:Transcript_139/g.302  ORF Transcript_139/g.302 Transcript_139/m.302 type:complete len:104 (-) Transcript_139:960-1271(-)
MPSRTHCPKGTKKGRDSLHMLSDSFIELGQIVPTIYVPDHDQVMHTDRHVNLSLQPSISALGLGDLGGDRRYDHAPGDSGANAGGGRGQHVALEELLRVAYTP